MFCEHSAVVPPSAPFSAKSVAHSIRDLLVRGLAVMSKPQMSVVLLYLIVLGSSISTKAQTFAITNVAIIDVTGGVVEPDKTIVVTGNVISRVGDKTTLHPPDGARVIDAHGQFLIPGLWDMHVHLGNATEAALPVLVSQGITGVRDMGSPSYSTLHR